MLFFLEKNDKDNRFLKKREGVWACGCQVFLQFVKKLSCAMAYIVIEA
jgi:hypothetical protein